ncbi:hypothetical protein B0H13DRAFT_2386534 [Mycena leptocephala]|nr:hypothetical protein B0H13DRAFT_2386534 [Mycena leptocephala]
MAIIFADSDGEPDVSAVLNIFNNAPSLRTATVLCDCSPAHSLETALPSAQLTHLEVCMHIGLREVRAILIQCCRLQAVPFSNCAGSQGTETPESVVRLEDLHNFNLHIEDDPTPEPFFRAFSFPNITDLVIHGDVWAPSMLQDLYDRSRFKLSKLFLGALDLSSHVLIEFLGRLPTLRELDLYYCGIDDDLLVAFTFDPTSPSPRLILPNLEKMTLSQRTVSFSDTALARMAESFCLHSGRSNSAFPAIKSVGLESFGDRLDSNIDRRLVAACWTGLISYEHVDHQENDDSG